MIRCLCCYILLLTCISGFSQEDSLFHDGIHWTSANSWSAVLNKANKEGKFIFVDCYATWCAPCKKMDDEVYVNQKVGYEVNPNFIAVRIRMDKTDDKRIVGWNKDADSLKNSWQIEGFPTYIFFSPDGRIIHKDVGFKDPSSFISLCKLARDPSKDDRYNELALWTSGSRDYTTMSELAIFSKELLGKQSLADSIARDFKDNYLDKLAIESLCTRRHLTFISNFRHLINSKDKIFNLCYNYPSKVAKILGDGWAEYWATATVVEEEIKSKIFVGGKPVTKAPDWVKMQKSIRSNYPKLDAAKIVLDYQLEYYSSIDINWNTWAKYKEAKLAKYPPAPPYGLSVYTDVNGWGGAWLVFIKCNELNILNKAIKWADLAINLEGEMPAYLDTKANLLYKIGRINEAIVLEEKAIAIAKEQKTYNDEFIQGLQLVVEQMKAHMPTYLHEHAEWNTESLLRIRARK